MNELREKGMNKYNFIPWISLDQARAEIVAMGNETGAEVNNYSLRLAVGYLNAGQEFPLLDQLEQYIIRKYSALMQTYLGDCKTSGQNCAYVLRDKMNMAKAVEAKYSGVKKFTGDCMRHGFCDHHVYGSQNINYKCGLCLEEKLDSDREPIPVIYHLDRNLLIRDFIRRNSICIDDFSNDCRVQVKPLQRYLDLKETLTASHWILIKCQIRKLLLKGGYECSQGLEFQTIFKQVIKRMEKNKNDIQEN